jgi:two-component system CheB/CheR fusion protein
MITKSDTEALALLLEKMYLDGGYDFRGYKRGTITRRLKRRLHATGTKTYRHYMRFLDTHPEEYQRLAEDLTIKTSGFFRSPHTFQQMARLVLPEMVSYKRRQGEYRLRIWSTACARGEEPYSIAILLTEFLGQSLPDFEVEVYATDVSRQALEEAQAGIFSAKDVEGLTAPLLESYFSYRSEAYRVTNSIRRMLRFSYLDLAATEEPPFLNLDCIFCCNILIYLQQKLQEKVLSMIYNSLATPGYLILGEVETPTNNLREKLDCLDIRSRIYKKT